MMQNQRKYEPHLTSTKYGIQIYTVQCTTNVFEQDGNKYYCVKPWNQIHVNNNLNWKHQNTKNANNTKLKWIQ